MKWYGVFLVVTVIIELLEAKNIKGHESIYLRTFNKLIKRPPIEQNVELNRAIQTEWIVQKLDHFNLNDTRTWKMRYMINDENFIPGGPIFIYVGGEWEIKPSSISSGHFVDIAKKQNAILFYTEHRFYGESQPFEDLSLEHLQYLNVDQALADLAYFIEYQRENNVDLANAKVILNGCSYSASMVTWFRRLYPALINGGWASSGPLIAKVDFPGTGEIFYADIPK